MNLCVPGGKETLRTLKGTVLLLRNGTALICSPNHKSVADAIHAAPQNSENRRQHDRRDEAVQSVHYPTVPGNDVT